MADERKKTFLRKSQCGCAHFRFRFYRKDVVMNDFIFSVKTQLAFFFQNLKARLFENLNHQDFSLKWRIKPLKTTKSKLKNT